MYKRRFRLTLNWTQIYFLSLSINIKYINMKYFD